MNSQSQGRLSTFPAPGGASSDVSEAALAALLRGVLCAAELHGADKVELPAHFLPLILAVLARQPSAPATAQNDAVRDVLQAIELMATNHSGWADQDDIWPGLKLIHRFAQDGLAALATPPAPVEQAPEREDASRG